MTPPSPPPEFYSAEYASLLRAGKWLGSLLVLAHGGQLVYDLTVWVPKMTGVLDAMVEGGRDRWPAAIGFLGSYLAPLRWLAVLLIPGGNDCHRHPVPAFCGGRDFRGSQPWFLGFRSSSE